MIEFKNVTKQFGNDAPILNDVSFSLEQGSFVYLVGTTGSGKTTIFRLIIRDMLATDGEITIGDWDITNLPKKMVPELRRRVGVIFQDYKLLTDRTVFENVLLPLQIAGFTPQDAQARAEEVLTEVGLAGKFDKFPQQLSGGESQRVAIARALVFEPEIIIADEPTGNLDQETSRQIIELLERINESKNATMFIATHNEKIIDESEARVLHVTQGNVEEKRAGKKKIKKSQSAEVNQVKDKVTEQKESKTIEEVKEVLKEAPKEPKMVIEITEEEK